MKSQVTDRLQHWLAKLEQMQPDKIELGLQRIKKIACQALLDKPDFRIITVAGTNGKGSTVAYIDAILGHSGFTTGVYTSPHFIEFNERIVINGECASDDLLCSAFEHIDKSRAEVQLTYFEFTTLAAIYCFSSAGIDVAILEVGLGGRLDAVNAWDPEVACISSIGIDHTDWLGDDRETIGREKAGVARPGRALVCGDTDPPKSIQEAALKAGAVLLQRGKDFDIEPAANALPELAVEEMAVEEIAVEEIEVAGTEPWHYRDPFFAASLPAPVMPGVWARDNASVAICACGQFLNAAPARESVESALLTVSMAGRMQLLDVQNTQVLLDVEHNRAAAEHLFRYLKSRPTTGLTYAVFGCMQDKDMNAIVDALATVVDHWSVVQIDASRAMLTSDIEAGLQHCGVQNMQSFASVIQGLESSIAQSGADDRVLVFGSFQVVGPALEWLDQGGQA